MTRLGILTIFLFTSLLMLLTSVKSSPILGELINTIEVNESSSRTIRLKSVLSLNKTPSSSSSSPNGSSSNTNKMQKIFWSFKRLYAMPNWTNPMTTTAANNDHIRTFNELSQVELMISLDSEVQDNLKYKYATSNETEHDDPMFDLIIYNLTFADSGIYKCNLWNQKTIYYKLIVSSPIEKPEISLEQSEIANNQQKQVNTNKLILESTDLTIKCLSQHAYPLPTFKWFENGIEIRRNEAEISNRLVDRETNSIESWLKLRKVRSEHHLRNFTCKLVQYHQQQQEETNDSDELLDLETRLNVGEQLWQVSDTVTLNVAFKPIVSLEVFKHSSPVSNVIRLSDTSTSSSSLSSLNLYQHDPDDVIFRCVYRANPSEPSTLSIVWKLNGVVQTAASQPDLFSWKKRSNLNDRRMNLSCEVTNSVGKSSFMVEINQLFEPRLKLNTTRYQVDEFAAIQLNCSVEASPAANLIEWRKYSYSMHDDVATSFRSDEDESSISRSSNFEVLSSDSLLEFKSIKHTDTHAAYFVCAALNSMNDSFGAVKFGERKFKFDVDVRFKPQMNVMSRKLAVPAHLIDSPPKQQPTSQNISCLCMSNPQPVFNWYKNGVKLNSSKYNVQAVISRGHNFFESVLTIAAVNEADLNTRFECEAMNQLGVNRWEIELVRESAPERPSDVRVDYVDFRRATVSWSPGFDGGQPQTFYLELNNATEPIEIGADNSPNYSNIKIIRLGPSSINLTGLNYNTYYSARLSARNTLGSSEWSDRVDIHTADLTESSAALLPQFESLFLNVPRNRLEFELKHSNNENDTIPVCFKITDLLLNSLDSPPYSLQNCLSFDADHDLDSYGQQFELDRLEKSDLMLLESPETVFNHRLVKSMRVSVCFRAKPSICAKKPTTAIIDTFNKMSPSYKHRTNENNNENSYLAELGSNVSNNRRFASFISANSKISIAIMVGVCACVFALCVILFGTVLYCIRKRNFKLCKALLSQQQSQQDQKKKGSDNSDKSSSNSSASSSTGSTGSSRVSSGSSSSSSSSSSSTDGGKKQKHTAEKTRDLPSVMSESEHRRQQQQQQQHSNSNTMTTNKPFSIDIASISAPISQQQQPTNLNMAPLSLATLNPINPLSTTVVSKTNSLNSRRAFTAALTATANTIIGKHKQQQQQQQQETDANDVNEDKIRVTEDDEKSSSVMMRRGATTTTTTTTTNPQQPPTVVFDDMMVDDDEVHNNSSDAPTSSNSSDRGGCSASSDDENKPIQVASSQTSSTAVSSSNCSSTHLGPPYTLYSPFDVATNIQQQHHQIIHHHHHHQAKIGFCSDSTGSNSDPIAINNSLSSNSTTDSPTYGYNLASGVNISQLHYHHNELVFVNNNNTSGHQVKTKPQEESGYSTPSRPKKVVYEVIV